jgi:hypothetical protein
MISASWYHVLLLLVGTLDIQSKTKDLGYDHIKEFKLKPTYVYSLLLLPLLLVPRLSNVQLEHLFITYAYVVFYKQIIKVVSPQSTKDNKLLPLTMSTLIILFNYNKIKRSRNNALLIYVYMMCTMYTMVGLRSVTTSESISDFVTSHMFFFISKLNY